MLYLKNVKKFYYHMLRGSACIFADERNKKRLLEYIIILYRKMDWYICSFCITDDSAYFITEADDQTQMHHSLQKMISQYLCWHQENAVWTDSVSLVQERQDTEVLESFREIALRSRQIHRIPLKKGYVSNISDYWWSSYITYMDLYIWEQVECQSLMQFFSPDQKTARRRIRRFHQDDENAFNIYNETENKK